MADRRAAVRADTDDSRDKVVARPVDSALRCDVCAERCTSGLALREHTIRAHGDAATETTGELREQVAQWLCEQRNDGGGWEYEPGRRYWREDADALLSGPLAPLLAKLRAVEALLPLWNESYEWRNAGGPDVAPHEEHVAQALWVVMRDLRRALDAES